MLGYGGRDGRCLANVTFAASRLLCPSNHSVFSLGVGPFNSLLGHQGLPVWPAPSGAKDALGSFELAGLAPRLLIRFDSPQDCR